MFEKLKQSPIKIGIILAVLIIINIVGWYLYFNWDTPFGDPLDLPTATEEMALDTDTETIAPGETEEALISTTPNPDFTATIEPVCGDDLSMTILVAGIDSEGYLFGLADSIRVVRIDFQTKKIVVLAFPRDLWVDITGTAAQGVTAGKLNQAYFYGTKGMGFYDGSGYGAGLLANTLQNNFGLNVDHYITVNIYAFRNIVDALGGLDVYFPEEIYIKHFEQPKLYLDAGTQHLDGKQAEQVVRARIDIGDFGRIRNQTLVLKALAAKMLTSNGIKQIPDLVTRLMTYVLTDFSAADVSKMACMAALIDPKEDIIFDNVIPVEEEAQIGKWIQDEYLGYMVYALSYDREVLTQKLADFQAGIWPEQ
ncbi:MAG: LCP family protein [Candidatus Electryonea clarkiae]|nr:LCP family protein [Candidatus Electryonea clarkiae]